jgi:RNA polymerase sigma-70 factor (ECF subfamily)
MFGSDGNDIPHLRRLLLWSPAACPGQPVILRLNERQLCPCRLQVTLGGDQVNEPGALDRLAESIKRQKPWESPSGRTGMQIKLSPDLADFLTKGGLEELLRFLAAHGVDPEVLRVESGCVKLTLSLPEDQAKRLSRLAYSGMLDQFGLLGINYVPLEHEAPATVSGSDLEGFHSYLVQRAQFLLGDPRVPVRLDAEQLASETLKFASGSAETALSADVTRAEQLARLEKIQDRMLVDSSEKSSIGQLSAQQETDSPTADYVAVSDKDKRPVDRPEWANTKFTQMLAGARAGNPGSWRDMVQLYAPLVHLWCRRRGLCGPRSQDAEDVVQDVFATVCNKIATFTKDGNPAAFARWLYTIFAFKWREHLALGPDQAIDPRGLALVPAPEDSMDSDGVSEGTLLLHRLVELVRIEFEDRTWEAFWRAAAEGRSARDVAEELGMSAAAVYTAKSRVLKRLREEAKALGLYSPEG